MELPQRLAGILGAIAFLGALLIGTLYLSSHYSVTLVLWRSLILFLLFVGFGWILGTLIVCWSPEEEKETEDNSIDLRFEEDPAEQDLLDPGNIDDTIPVQDNPSMEPRS